MLIVAIVGDHGSGKTTFLGLLYATLVRSGSSREDALRFSVAYDSMEEIGGLYQGLMSGGFPDTATKEGIHELRLELGSPRSKHGLLRLGSRKWAADAATTVRFCLPGSLDEATPGLHGGSTFGTGRWRDVLDADAVVFMVDGTKLAPKPEGQAAGPMAAYDGRIDSLITSIRRWRSRGGREVVHPLFVVSKFDRVASAVLHAAGLDPTPPPVSKSGARAAYAKAILEPNLPRTLATLRDTGKGKPRFATADTFFTSVALEKAAPGEPPKIRLRRTDGAGWEPDYTQPEYLAFLDRLARIAAETEA